MNTKLYITVKTSTVIKIVVVVAATKLALEVAEEAAYPYLKRLNAYLQGKNEELKAASKT